MTRLGETRGDLRSPTAFHVLELIASSKTRVVCVLIQWPETKIVSSILVAATPSSVNGRTGPFEKRIRLVFLWKDSFSVVRRISPLSLFPPMMKTALSKETAGASYRRLSIVGPFFHWFPEKMPRYSVESKTPAALLPELPPIAKSRSAKLTQPSFVLKENVYSRPKKLNSAWEIVGQGRYSMIDHDWGQKLLDEENQLQLYHRWGRFDRWRNNCSVG